MTCGTTTDTAPTLLAEAAAVPTTTKAIATGANLTLDRAIGTMTMPERSVVVPAAIDKTLMNTDGIAVMMHFGRNVTETIASAPSTREIPSHAACTSREAWSARSFAIVTASTPSADRNRALATLGAFRVVSSRDLRDHDDRSADPRSGDLRHLREQGLVEAVRVPGYREQAVALTKEGRSLLEHHRDRDREHPQTFYDGVRRERELEHGVQVYRAYEREAEALLERGARIERVVLDYELKREYQKWLHERDGDRDDYDGHPDRTAEEIEAWAREHDLPYFDDEVHFPDLRIDYEEPDGRWDHDDIEVTTEHYRGAHAASVARSGFVRFGASSARVGGSGRARDPRLAEEFSGERGSRPRCHGVRLHSAPSTLPGAGDAAERVVCPTPVRALGRHR